MAFIEIEIGVLTVFDYIQSISLPKSHFSISGAPYITGRNPFFKGRNKLIINRTVPIFVLRYPEKIPTFFILQLISYLARTIPSIRS
jgi:hypothetical protein